MAFYDENHNSAELCNFIVFSSVNTIKDEFPSAGPFVKHSCPPCQNKGRYSGLFRRYLLLLLGNAFLRRSSCNL